MSGPPPSDDGASATYHRVRGTRKATAVLCLLAGVGLAWWRWRPFRLEVEGRSMEPTLVPGDWGFAVRVRAPRPGDVVVFEYPGRPGVELVKRIVAGPGGRGPGDRQLDPRMIWVEGDARDRSTDSRTFGPLDVDGLRGRVVAVWWPLARGRFL